MNLKINIRPLSYVTEMAIKRASVLPGSYGKLTDSLVNSVRKRVSGNISRDMVHMIRSAYTKEKIMFRHNSLKKNAKRLYHDFKHGKSIVELSKKYDYAPMAIVRQFLMKHTNKKRVKELLRNPNKIQDNKLKNSVKNINKNELDVFVTVDQEQSAKFAEEFEVTLGEFLTANGVEFRTQEDLAAEQVEKYGRAINTPDFLIVSDLSINGKKINWIDAKNFYGANAFMIRFSVKKQMKKYIKEWGHGAVVFSLGFSEKLHVGEDVMLINYSSLKN
jgi:hypothetical protein